MPELPEVEIIVRDLKNKVLLRTFIDVWTDTEKIIKKPKNFKDFKKEIKGKKIQKIWRRGKNILFDLSGNKILLVHQKLTGHFLVGHWSLVDNCWQPQQKGPLQEKVNTYIHLMFWLSGDLMLALSDLRKFAKIELWESKELSESEGFKNLGPEPLQKDFTFQEFKRCLEKRRGKIKQVLMDQKIISGIGNIYSDEILWEAKIHPFGMADALSEKELKEIYKSMKRVLNKAIKLGGASISDFRDTEGRRGSFDKVRRVYRREGEKCFRCGSEIVSKKLVGRSAHFCPKCQKV